MHALKYCRITTLVLLTLFAALIALTQCQMLEPSLC